MTLPFRIGISNLAWSPGHAEAAMALVAEGGGAGIEIAPTRLAHWDDLTETRLRGCALACRAAGLQVSSLQAIFYDRPGVALLEDPARFEAMCEHVKRVGDVAQALGATIAVFGAPRSRLKGAMSGAEALRLGADRLRTLGGVAAEYGLRLGIESVPPYYGCDFLTTPSEVAAMVAACSHPSIAAHFDIACTMLAGGDPAAELLKSDLIHFHIAEPDLAPLRHPRCDHPAAAAALREIGYDGWRIIEMREDKDDDLAAVRDAMAFATHIYGNGIEPLC